MDKKLAMFILRKKTITKAEMVALRCCPFVKEITRLTETSYNVTTVNNLITKVDIDERM